MIIGYARVSTNDQNPDLQVTALEKAGAEQVFQKTFTGTLKGPPEKIAGERLTCNIRGVGADRKVVYRGIV